MRLSAHALRAGLLLFGVLSLACPQPRSPSLLIFTGVHREQALDVWALTEHLVSSRGYDAVVLGPDSLAPEFRQTAGGLADDRYRDECRGGSLTLITYPSVAFEEYQAHGRGSINELTSVLNFHLANCASLLLNRTTMDSLGAFHFTAMLGVAMDPCSTFLADKLRIRRRAAYDDGSATSLLWGVLLGHGHPTSHVASYGSGLGGGAMTTWQRLRNVVQYHRLQLWHSRVYDPRVAAFRKRHRLVPPPPLPSMPETDVHSPAGRGPAGGSRGGSSGGRGGGDSGAEEVVGGPTGRVACHLRGQVIITGADWGLVEPQPLSPAVKLVGPLRARPSPPPPPPAAPLQPQPPPPPPAQSSPDSPEGGEVRAQPQSPPQPQQQPPASPYPALYPPELAAHVAAAERGLSVIYFPPDYRLPLRALLALAEAVIDLRQHIVWQAAETEIARVRQLYLPLKHARHILMLSEVPLPDLLAQRQVVSLVTAGSVQAIYAAIYAGKPVMAVPLNAAQEDLVARVAALGAGQALSRLELEGGAASYKVSVAMERMRNVYSYTQSMQLLSTQLRATHGAMSSLEAAAAWLDYTTSLDEAGRQYLVPRSTLPAAGGAAAAAVAFGSSATSGGAPAAGGGGGCMGPMEAVNAVAYGLLVAAGVGAAALVWLVVHICTRVPKPRPLPSSVAGSSRRSSRHERGVVRGGEKSKDE